MKLTTEPHLTFQQHEAEQIITEFSVSINLPFKFDVVKAISCKGGKKPRKFKHNWIVKQNCTREYMMNNDCFYSRAAVVNCLMTYGDLLTYDVADNV